MLVEFKSSQEFYYKEATGLKNNTVRFDDKGERFDKLREFEDCETEHLTIKIVCRETGDWFIRQVRDVSIYKDEIFIITWDCV